MVTFQVRLNLKDLTFVTYMGEMVLQFQLRVANADVAA
jgi:hypothetical protein